LNNQIKNLPRLAILAPHVIQYHAPIYREVAATRKVSLKVLYCSRFGLEPIYEKSMGTSIRWDVPLLAGYDYEFLSNYPGPSNFPIFGRINPGILRPLLGGEYDVILIQDYTYITSWLAIFAAKLAGIKIIFRGEGTFGRDDVTWKSNIKKRIISDLLRTADAILYSCTGNKAWLESLGADSRKMSLIPCSVDNHYFESQLRAIRNRGISPRSELGFREDIPYVLNCARFDRNKRILDIVEAVSMLQKSGSKVGLILVGNGPLYSEIKQKVCDLGLEDVHMPGFVNMSRISLYYASADVFVLTSGYDASPKALSEALIFSLPVVCTNIVGTSFDLVKENGYSFNVGDIETLAARILSIISDRNKQRCMGMRSHELSQEWSINAAAESVVDTVNRLIYK